MKNIAKYISIVILLFLSHSLAFCQNLPDWISYTSSSFAWNYVNNSIPGSITNSVPLPSPFNSGSNPTTGPTLFNYKRTFYPEAANTNASSITETSSPSYYRMTTTYTDGFGRPIQTINRYDNITGNSTVVPFNYRPSANRYSFSPYSITGDARFRNSPYTEQYDFYNSLYSLEPGMSVTETSEYSDATKRAIICYPQGKSQIGQKRGVTKIASTNKSNEVIIWTIDATAPNWPHMSGYYTSGQLYKITKANADGGLEEDFYDKDNKLICKNVLMGYGSCNIVTAPTHIASYAEISGSTSENPNDHLNATNYFFNANSYPSFNTATPILGFFNGPSDPTPININQCPIFQTTYYVYDIFDRLMYTLPPKAVSNLRANSWIPTTSIVSNLCYYQLYDQNGRVIQSHKAGENGDEYFVDKTSEPTRYNELG